MVPIANKITRELLDTSAIHTFVSSKIVRVTEATIRPWGTVIVLGKGKCQASKKIHLKSIMKEKEVEPEVEAFVIKGLQESPMLGWVRYNKVSWNKFSLRDWEDLN